MSQTISQNLPIPPNVVAGGSIQATDVSTIYSSLNSFTIPDVIASLLQSAYSTNSPQTAIGPATTTGSVIDVPINVAQNKILLHAGSFTWQTPAGLGSLAFRANASTGSGSTSGYLVTPVVSASTSGNGMFLLVHTPHDATYQNAAVAFIAMSTGNTFTVASTSALPNAAWTSIGVGLGTNSSTGTMTLGFQRVWRES
jgi:hypothetical protein